MYEAIQLIIAAKNTLHQPRIIMVDRSTHRMRLAGWHLLELLNSHAVLPQFLGTQGHDWVH